MLKAEFAKIDNDAVYGAYYNSYLVYTGKKTVDEITRADIKSGKGSTVFMHYPNLDIDKQTSKGFNKFIQVLIEFFSECEQYEICNELKSIKKNETEFK